jgi:CheY-like chemotaxis protein
MAQIPIILYVGEDRARLGIMSRVLKYSGYRMTSATSEDAALAACRSREFITAVVLDEVGTAGGVSVAESIAGITDIPIVLLSAKSARRGSLPKGVCTESASPLEAVACLRRALAGNA